MAKSNLNQTLYFFLSFLLFFFLPPPSSSWIVEGNVVWCEIFHFFWIFETLNSNYNSLLLNDFGPGFIPLNAHALSYPTFLYRCQIFASKTQFETLADHDLIMASSLALIIWYCRFVWKVVDDLVNKLLPYIYFSKLFFFYFVLGNQFLFLFVLSISKTCC